MKVKIDIDTGTFIRFWVVVICFGLAGFAVYSARAAIILVIISFFFALALNSPVNYLAKHLPGKTRLFPTAVAYISVVVVLGLFVFLVVPPIIQQTSKLADQIPSLIESNQNSIDGVNHLIDKYHLQPQIDEAIGSIQDNANKWATNVGTNILSGISSLLGFLVSLVVVIVMSFLMLLEGPSWIDRLWMVYSDNKRKKHHKKLISKMNDVMVGYVNGQLTVAAVAGAAAGIFVFILSFIFSDVPANLALPTMAIAGVLSLVPMFGATVAGILITLMLALNSVAAAIAFIVYFVIYQQIENNFISPVIQSKTVQLSALVIIIAVSIGTYAFGLIGGIISIPIAGWVKVLIEDYLEQREHKTHSATKKSGLKSILKTQKDK